MKKQFFGLLFFITLPILLTAQSRPTPDEASKVIDYYLNGSSMGVVLLDYKLCRTIVKNECSTVVTSNTDLSGPKSHYYLNKDQKIYLWMKFMVPLKDKAKISIHYKKKRKIVKSIETVLSGSLRYRSWKIVPTENKGNWEVVIQQEIEKKVLSLGIINFTVK